MEHYFNDFLRKPTAMPTVERAHTSANKKQLAITLAASVTFMGSQHRHGGVSLRETFMPTRFVLVGIFFVQNLYKLNWQFERLVV